MCDIMQNLFTSRAGFEIRPQENGAYLMSQDYPHDPSVRPKSSLKKDLLNEYFWEGYIMETRLSNSTQEKKNPADGRLSSC